MKPSKLLRDVLKRIRSAAGTFEDNRQGPNLRYTLVDAVLSAFACFFLQSPSFLAFQRRMQDDVGRSGCQTLFGMQGIPSDGQIRNLLDRLVPDSFQFLFLHLLDTLRSKGDFSPFVRLTDRILASHGQRQAFLVLPYHGGGGCGGSRAQPGGTVDARVCLHTG